MVPRNLKPLLNFMVFAIIVVPGCRLGRRNVVGMFVGSCMQADAPSAGGSGEPMSIVAEWHQKGRGVVVGGRGGGAAGGRRPTALGSTFLCNPLLLPFIVLALVVDRW